MPFCGRTTRLSFTCAALACLLGSRVRAEDIQATYTAQAGYTLHLLEAGRYGEAGDAAQALVTAQPDRALPYALRGTVALYVGSTDRAQADFDRAAGLAGGPVTLYGQALTLLSRHKSADARTALGRAAKAATLTPAEADDLGTLRAYVQLLDGDAAGAAALAGKAVGGGGDDAARAEVAALAAYRADPKAGTSQIREFLRTPSGVSHVREEDGLRLLFEAQRPLEPAVTEPELQTMYADRISGGLNDAVRKIGTIQTCLGVTPLAPPETLPSGTALVSYSVDGQMAAMVGAPFTFRWDSRKVANGTHTVRVDAADAAGNALLSQTQTVRVANLDGEAADTGTEDPATAALETRLWNLLRPRPARKVAEWTLAQAALGAGDKIGADSHLANAAALDPSYKDGRRFARALFGSAFGSAAATVAGRVASSQPVVLWTGGGGKRQIALTFDDGPSLAKTPALLDALDRTKAPATFFVVGSRAEAAPDVVRRMARRGDDVENHSYTHPNMNLVIPSVAEGELLRTSVLIRALTGRHPRFFRPPGGNANPAVQRLAHAYGLILAYWTVDAIHAEDVGSPTELIRYVLAHVHPGSIVLLHNGPEVTTAALPGLVSALRAQGYTLVTLSHLNRPQPGAKPLAGAKMPKMKE